MNKKRSFLLLLLLMGMLLVRPGLTLAQEVQVKRSDKVVTVGSKKFYMHHVQAGETLYSIAKVYHVTEDEIKQYNPELKNGGLKAKMVIGIPYVEEPEAVAPAPKPVTPEPVKPTPEPVEPKPEPVEPKPEPTVTKPETDIKVPQVSSKLSDTIVEVGGKKYVMHYVKPGETVWGLSRDFRVPESEIVAKNPEIKEGLKAGMVIGIPYVEAPKPVVVEEPKPEEPKIVAVKPEQPKQEEIKPVKVEEPKPVVVEEPKPEEPKIVVVKPEPVVVEPEPIVVEEPKPVVVSPSGIVPPLSEGDEYGEGYVIHTVQKSEKTRTMLRDWDVSIDEFRQLNPSVGSRVFEGQKVLIPYQVPLTEPTTAAVGVPEEPEPIVEEEPVVEIPVEVELPEENAERRLLYSEEDKPLDCLASRAYANHHFHVALLVPLYLNDIDKIEASQDRSEKSKKSRALRFLQFYEGFMMAVRSLTDEKGLQLELSVIDVTENTAGAEAAVEQLRGQDIDLIIGPFFSKSFAVVEDYAASQGIMVVNPLSERESVVADASNVLKLKPSMDAMVTELADLIRYKYPKSKVTLITPANVKDSLMVEAIENSLATVVQPEVELSNAEMLELIQRESQRRKMGKRVLSTLEVEGQVFSTKALEAHPDDVTYFQNHFQHITYSDSDIKTFREGLSAARDNVLVAYGDDLVFATKILNNINKSARKYPITLIGLPDWNKFENLLVQNLLNLNAIYFDDHFVNYNDSLVQQFVEDFRDKYDSEPDDYAFEGYDVGWYFMNALMEFGPQPMECLPYYHLPLLHSNYYFNKSRRSDGLENRYWNVFQYDNHAIELKPVKVYPGEQ